MRTLKKTLCLVLVLAMVMGFGVTANAAYVDADEITYKEAVDVLSMLKVMEGDENGFRPTDTLTRAEACAIITRLLGADDYAIATSQFKDVKTTDWFAGYVAFCYNAGIVDGYGNGKFGPQDKLTGYQWAKMLLCALGFDAKATGMTGDAWQIAVAKLAKANNIFAGNLDADKTVNATREEAALYALNTLEAYTVEYVGGTSFEVAGIKFTSGGTQKQGTAEAPTTKTFMGEYFTKLSKDTTTLVADDYGRPGYTWVLTGKTVADTQYVWVGDEAAAVYTEGFNATEYKALNTAKADLANAMVYVNGKIRDGANSDQALLTAEDVATRNYVGTIVELYNMDTDVAIERVVVVEGNYTVVKSVVSSYTAANADKNYIELTVYQHGDSGTTVKLYDDKTTTPSDYDKLVAKYAKDDILLTYWNGACVDATRYIEAEDLTAVAVATINSTKLGASDRGTIVADGKTYTMASAYSNGVPTIGAKGAGTLYIDANGYVAGYKATSAAPAAKNYGLVLAYAKATGVAASNITGEAAKDAYERVQLVNAAGEKVILDTAFELNADGLTFKKLIADTALASFTAGDLVVYELDAAGKITKIEKASSEAGVAATHTKGNAFTIVKGGSVYADDSTVIFVTGTDTNSQTVYTTYTGYSNLPSGKYTAKQAYYFDKGADAVSVVLTEAIAAYTTPQYAVITDGTPVVTAAAKTGYFNYSYKAIVDGQETTIAWVATTAPSAAKAGQLSTITFDKETGLVGSFTKVDDAAAVISAKAAGYYITTGANYVDADTVYYEVSFDTAGAVTGFAAVDGLTLPGASDTFVAKEFTSANNKAGTAKAVVFFYTVADAQ